MLYELDKIVEKNIRLSEEGLVASYIPELHKVNPNQLGVAICDLNGDFKHAGDSKALFTIQSVSKPLVLILALMLYGEDRVFQKVGMEPTGDPFNSIVRLETGKTLKKPYNPMINAGAIAVTGLIQGNLGIHQIDPILDLIRKMSGNPHIVVNEAVYRSEKETGNRNRSMAYFLKDIGILEGDVETILDLYFMHCAIEADACDLARIGAILANGGVHPQTGERFFSKKISRIISSFMITCGMYDASGEFAVTVGIPSKSGVGGGILSVVPGRMGIGVFGPALDEKGNSKAGIAVLKDLSQVGELSIF